MTFALRHWRLIGTALIIAALLGTTGYYRIDRDHWKRVAAVLRIDLTKARAQTEAEIAKHEATKRAYVDAQAEAERLEAERLARVTARQKEITNDIAKDYRARIARAGAAYERLRREAAGDGGAFGAAEGMQVHCLPDAAGGIDGAACPLSPDERLTAEKQAIRLEALQGFVRKQAAVPAN